MRSNRPDEFIDAEQAPPPTGTDRLEPSEKEAYEALCREGRPLVSYSVITVLMLIIMEDLINERKLDFAQVSKNTTLVLKFIITQSN